MSLKKMSEIFHGISFPFHKSTFNRLLCKAGHIICSSSKGKNPFWGLTLASLTLWLREKNKQEKDSLESGKPDLLLRRYMFLWAKWSLSFPFAENCTLAPLPIKWKQKFLLPRGNEMFK